MELESRDGFSLDGGSGRCQTLFRGGGRPGEPGRAVAGCGDGGDGGDFAFGAHCGRQLARATQKTTLGAMRRRAYEVSRGAAGDGSGAALHGGPSARGSSVRLRRWPPQAGQCQGSAGVIAGGSAC
jgi:hypothetical protein